MIRNRWAIGGTISAIILAGLALLGWQYKLTYDDVQAARIILAADVELLNDGLLDLPPERVAALEADFERASGRLDSARTRLDRDPLYALSGKLPWIGDQKKGLDTLLSLASDLSAAGAAGSRTLKAAPVEVDPDGGAGRQLLELTADHAADLRLVQSATARVLDERERLLDRSLAGPLGEARDELLSYSEQLSDVHALASFGLLAPRALGQERPRRYLFLGMDNGELMPGGGYIGDVAVFTLREGELELGAAMSVRDLFDIWLARPNYKYVPPPEPLRRYLLGDDIAWAMGEASWFPDFPTTSTTAQYFLAEAGLGEVDATVGLTVAAMEALVEITGPIELPEFGLTFTSSELGIQISRVHNGEGGRERLRSFVDGMMSELFKLDRSRWRELWNTTSDLAARKLILLHFNDPGLQQATVELGWDGTLPPPDARDTVLLADSSVRSTKLNLALKQSAEIGVDLSAPLSRHRFVVRYHNAYDEWKVGRDPKLAADVIRPGAVDLLGNYVQLFVPPGATLTRLQRVDTDGVLRNVAPEFQGPSLGYQTFATFLPLAIGDKKSLAFEYVAPPKLRREGDRLIYELAVQKQPGVPSYRLNLQVIPPAGYRAGGGEICRRIESGCETFEGAGINFELASDTLVRIEFAK